MGDIPDKSPEDLTSTIRESNEKSKTGSQQYLFWAEEAEKRIAQIADII